MLTRRPSPFLIGIVIGSLLHLLVLPWLSTTQAQSAQPFTDNTLAPPTIEYAGLRFAVPEGSEELFYQHLVIRDALMGDDFPERGSLVTTTSAVVGQIDAIHDDSALIPGATHRGTLATTDASVGAELFVLTSIHLDTERVALADHPALPPSRPIDAIDATLSLVSMIVTTEFGVQGLDTLVIASEAGTIFLPLSALTDNQVTAAALAGATDHLDRFDDPISADLVLYGAHEHGYRTEGFMYLTENVWQMTLEDGQRSFNPLMFKNCGCDCDGDGIQETPLDPASEACLAINEARIMYDTCVGKAMNAYRTCVDKAEERFGVALIISIAWCVATLWPGFISCIVAIVGAESALIYALRDCQQDYELALDNCLLDFKAAQQIACLSTCTAPID